jgi:hypothetical protein
MNSATHPKSVGFSRAKMYLLKNEVGALQDLLTEDKTQNHFTQDDVNALIQFGNLTPNSESKTVMLSYLQQHLEDIQQHQQVYTSTPMRRF